MTRVMADIDLGPVGQSSVSLTSSLRGQLVGLPSDSCDVAFYDKFGIDATWWRCMVCYV